MLRKRLLLALILLPALAIGAEGLVWLLVVRQVQLAFQEWVAARHAEGWRLDHGAERLGGWPFAATVGIAGFSISGGMDVLPGGLSWRSEHLTLQLDLLFPGHLFVHPSGRQRLRVFGSPVIALAANQLEAKLPLAVLPFMGEPRVGDEVVITASDVRAGLADVDPHLVALSTLAIHAALGPSAAGGNRTEMSVRLHATRVSVDRRNVHQLGGEIGLFSFSGALIGHVPPGASWTARLHAWRSSGGMLAIRGLSLIWGPLAIGASGQLMLDREMQPAGRGTARVVGYAATLDALAAAGKIGTGAATAVKAILMLLARPPRAGRPPEVDVPLRLKNRTLSLGRIPFLKMPLVTWPSAH
ncbi:MAG: DUF2125 domain-containing protein [Rhodospirillales bacterium]|nr:DUF2125 domain-containing protein [Rhodospirillales bacterium]